jgi:hypothetical protein
MSSSSFAGCRSSVSSSDLLDASTISIAQNRRPWQEGAIRVESARNGARGPQCSHGSPSPRSIGRATCDWSSPSPCASQLTHHAFCPISRSYLALTARVRLDLADQRCAGPARRGRDEDRTPVLCGSALVSCTLDVEQTRDNKPALSERADCRYAICELIHQYQAEVKFKITAAHPAGFHSCYLTKPLDG